MDLGLEPSTCHRIFDYCSSRDPRRIESIANEVDSMEYSYAFHGRRYIGHLSQSALKDYLIHGYATVLISGLRYIVSWQRSKKHSSIHSHSFFTTPQTSPNSTLCSTIGSLSALSTIHLSHWNVEYLGSEPCRCPHKICFDTIPLTYRATSTDYT